MQLHTRILSTLSIAACCVPLLLAGQATAPAPGAAPRPLLAAASPLLSAPMLTSTTWARGSAAGRSVYLAKAFRPLLPQAAGEPAAVDSPPPIYVPTYELFVGYSNFRAISQGASGNRVAWLSGLSASLALNFNQYVGLVLDLGGYRDTRFGPNAPPLGGVVPATGSAYTIMVGPRFSWRHDRLTPFVQVLFGGTHISNVTLTNCTGAGCTPLPSESSYALNAGGGLDLTLTRHLAVRLFQVEYAMTRFRDPNSGTGQAAYQSDARLSTGLVFRFGGSSPAVATASLPPTESCSATPDDVVAGSGDLIAVSAQATDPSGYPLTYSWNATAGAVTGGGANVQWDAAGVPAGSYTITGGVDNGHGGTAACEASVEVTPQPAQPLTLSCVAEPTTLASGESAELTAVGGSSDGHPLTYTWQASQGAITGSGPVVDFDSTGLAAGTYTVNGHVENSAGASADCSLALAVTQLPVTALQVALSLHSIYFPTDQPNAAEPNEGLLASQRAILRALAVNFQQYLQQMPNARITLEGHADDRASAAFNQALAERRVEISKSYLVAQGVPAANIEIHSFGKRDQLDAARVRAEINKDPDLTNEQRQALFANLPSIVLAQNRRVDILLNATGQASVRRYPFNAEDALTLLSDTALRQ